ncbi:hypothetical protein IscW_ISCW008244, partial [Ixodes scapularis]
KTAPARGKECRASVATADRKSREGIASVAGRHRETPRSTPQQGSVAEEKRVGNGQTVRRRN